MTIFRSFATVLLLATPAIAQAPRVATDIAPVHALAAQVMAGVGTPDLLVMPKASPHSYALRPSQAQALQQADLVIWIGPQLTPWLAKPLTALAGDAGQLVLLAAEGTVVHDFRAGLDLGHGDHEDHDHDTDGHQEHDDHDHEDHDHRGDVDPHAWLDPENGKVWLSLIAGKLAALDPDNAAVYRANADRARAELDVVSAEIAQILEPVRARPFVTFHDAYQYFETRFGLAFAGAVSLGDATDPSPARLTALAAVLREDNIRCAFSEPQFDDRLLLAATEQGDLQIGSLDPMGSQLQPGPDLYARLLRAMANSLASCQGN